MEASNDKNELQRSKDLNYLLFLSLTFLYCSPAHQQTQSGIYGLKNDLIFQ